jgi:hypothetical protein
MATVKKIAQELGLESQKNIVYAKKDQYLFTLRQVIDLMNSHNTGKYLYVPLNGITQSQAVSVLNYFKENKKTLRLVNYDFNGPVLVCRLNENLKGLKSEQFEQLMNQFVTLFKELDIATEPICIHCGLNQVNAVMKIDKITFHAHEDCIRSAQGDLERAKEEHAQINKNYGRGLLGATLGAVIGAIPWILLEMFWGFAALLSLLIAYGALYGYKTFGGVVTKATKWLMIIPIIVAVLISNIMKITSIIIMDNAPLTLENYIYIYTHPDNLSIILGSLGMGLLFAGAGVVYIFYKVKEQELNTVIE